VSEWTEHPFDGTIDAKRAPESCVNSPGALTETSCTEGASALTHSMARLPDDSRVCRICDAEHLRYSPSAVAHVPP